MVLSWGRKKIGTFALGPQTLPVTDKQFVNQMLKGCAAFAGDVTTAQHHRITFSQRLHGSVEPT